MTSREYLEIALGGNMNVATLRPLALCELLDGYAKELKAENAKLKEALEAWQLMDTESYDKNPVPCYIMRGQYRAKARALTEQALKEKP